MGRFKLALTLLVILSTEINLNSQWVQINNGMGYRLVNSIVSSGNNIFAGTDQGVFITSNGGQNWTQSSLTTFIWSLASSESTIYAGTWGQGVYKSTNNGQNWSQASNQLSSYWIASVLINSSNVFAGTGIQTNQGVFRTTDNGQNWNQSLSTTAVFAITTNGTNIYAGSRWGGIYLSTNNGQNWSQTSVISNTYLVYSFAISGTKIFAGTLNSGSYIGAVHISTNNGTNWIQTSLNNMTVYSLAAYGSTIFAGTDSSAYMSTNDGVNWVHINEGIENDTVRSLLIIQNYVYAGTVSSSVWKRPLSELVGIHQISTEIPNQVSLSQNCPNPFNPSTSFRFAVSGLSNVKIIVYDMLGREVETLVNEQLQPGTYEVDFDGSKFSSGVYYYKLIAGDYTETRKMVLIK